MGHLAARLNHKHLLGRKNGLHEAVQLILNLSCRDLPTVWGVLVRDAVKAGLAASRSRRIRRGSGRSSWRSRSRRGRGRYRHLRVTTNEAGCAAAQPSLSDGLWHT